MKPGLHEWFEADLNSASLARNQGCITRQTLADKPSYEKVSRIEKYLIYND
jgi:hypothetical protein